MVTKEPTENLKGISRFRFIFSRDKKAPVAISVILIFILSALFAPWLAPYDPNEMTLDMMSAPSKMH
ncbi:MAG: ABC transporter permease, partial [Paracoccaceae bacterium]|nr:ABC transporter permease [Paracoccaceae bacterium]